MFLTVLKQCNTIFPLVPHLISFPLREWHTSIIIRYDKYCMLLLLDQKDVFESSTKICRFISNLDCTMQLLTITSSITKCGIATCNDDS